MAYVTVLYEEYRRVAEFCFDVDFYPEDLRGLSAAERFGIYTFKHFFDVEIDFKQRFNVIAEEYTEISAPEGVAQCDFEKDFDFPGGLLDEVRKVSLKPHAASICTSLREMLAFELFQMLWHDVRIKKCKNCGEYFILKGNYKVDYCTNVRHGETQTCQALAAARNYKSKVDDSTAMQLYNRFYKKYHARVKVGTLKPGAFKDWKYEAVVMRDRCLDPKDKGVDLAGFEAWLEGREGV